MPQTLMKVQAPDVYADFANRLQIDPSEIVLSFQTRSYPGATPRPIRFYDDGDGPLWIARDTGGILGIVRCRGESNAYEIVSDEFRTPIAPEDVHDAYGAFDQLLEWMEAKGHENNQQLREFCTRYDRQFFEFLTIGNRESVIKAWPDGEMIDLIEGYEHQSNATGTGIVSIDLNGESLELLTPELLLRLEIETVVTFA